jgi:TonB family protein
VHAGLLALPAGDGPGAPATRVPAVLEAMLSAQVDPPSAALQALSPAPMPLALLPVLALPPLATASAMLPDRIGELAVAASVDQRVAAQQVTALARLGDFAEREMNEFPREVQAPVRYQGTIEARYPPAARAQGIEGSVVAWVVVDAQANVEEIEFVEGDDVFRESVTEAIRAARFMPAADGGVGLRFPIALEFRFVLDDRAGAAHVAAASPD